MPQIPLRLRRWGNSLAALIPAEAAREHGLKEGDDILVEFRRAPSIREAFGSMPDIPADFAQRMKDEDREAW